MLFGSVLATNRRSHTRLVRRAQGFFADLLIFAFLYSFPTALIFALLTFAPQTAAEYTEAPIRKFFAVGFDWLPVLVPLTAVAFVFLGRRIKDDLALLYSKLLRFIALGRFGYGGSARFAGLLEEWGSRFEPGKNMIFTGRSLYSRFLNIGLEDDRHMITIAGSRAGKGRTCIIPNLLLWEGSALVIDPKGTNAAVTAQRRRDMGQDVHIVDPFGILGQESATFNALDALDPKSLTVREDIEVIADALVVGDPKRMDGDHWDEGARTILSGLIAELITEKRYRTGDGPPTLPMLRDLLRLKDKAPLWIDMSHNPGAGKAAMDAAAGMIEGAGTDETINFLSNANKHSKWLSFPSMERLLSNSTFSFADLKKKPTTIYLIVPPEYLDVHQRFLRLFINLALMEMPRGGKSKIPILMILDEFLQLGKMAQVERGFRLLAGYNFVIWPFVQDYGSLADLYGGSVSAFVTNSRAVQVFAVDDERSLKFVSDKIGERSMEHMLGMDSLRVTPLRTPKEASVEITRLPPLHNGKGEMQYILRTGHVPLLLEKVRYNEDEGKQLTADEMRSWMPLPVLMEKIMKRTLFPRLYPFRGLYGKDPDFHR